MPPSLKTTLRQFSYRLPRSEFIYRLCKLYVYNYRGENESDRDYNGEKRILAKLMRGITDAVLLDVGANRGQWAEEVLRYAPNAQIHCFEPVPKTFQLLSERGFPANVHLNNLGMGDVPGTLSMFIFNDTSELNSLYDLSTPTRPTRGKLEVAISTIADYVRQHQIDRIYFLKIDTEGHDQPVIAGARSLFQEGRIRYAQFEYGTHWLTSGHTLGEVFQVVRDLPYDFYKIAAFGLIRVGGYSMDLDNFAHANYLLAHRDAALPADVRVV